MSKMLIKMIADMAGVSPEEIIANITDFQGKAIEGIQLLEQMDNRLRRIERALNIPQPEIVIDGSAVEMERQE